MIREVLHWLGFGLCHQLAERSFFGDGYQVPVCARDTGIYIGFLSSLVLLAWLGRGRRPSELPRPAVMMIGVAFIAVMAWDGLTSNLGWRSTTNDVRLATGLAAGFAIALFLVPILNGQLWRHPGRERVLDGAFRVAVWTFGLPFSYAVTYWALPAAGIAYPLLVGGAILATFVSVNLALACLLPPFERRAVRWVEVWRPALVALGLTAIELTVSATLKMWLLGLNARR